MKRQVETVAYLGPAASFSHEAAEELRINDPVYRNAKLMPASTIEEVCQMVVDGTAKEAVVPIDNSTDGPVGDTLKAMRRHPLRVRMEDLRLIKQDLYFRRDADPARITLCISKGSANGQCRQTIPKYLPYALFDTRDSTVAAILEAAENPELAAIGPSMAGRVYNLTERMVQIHNVHDNPLNTTRFWVVSTGEEDNPSTGNDKTSFIAQIPDKAGNLYAVLDTFADQGINLAKIKSFGRDGGEIAFLMTLQGHQQDLPLTNALRRLNKHGIRTKMLGSYPQSTFQLPNIPWEFDINYAIDQLRSGIFNGIKDKTVVAYMLKDRAGALKDSLKPFKDIDLKEIDSLPTGRLGEYIFYLAFDSKTPQKDSVIDELNAQCTKLVLL